MIESSVVTSMLSLPLNFEETVSMSLILWGREDRSQTEPVTWKPFKLTHSLKHELRWASFREHVCTVAPSAANSSTIACLIRAYTWSTTFTQKSTLQWQTDLSAYIHTHTHRERERERERETQFLWFHRSRERSFPEETTWLLCSQSLSLPLPFLLLSATKDLAVVRWLATFSHGSDTVKNGI